MSIIELGGNIELVGFKELDGGSMVIVKKLVGNHVRKMNDMAENFQKLTLTMKTVHGDNGKFEIHAKVIDNGKPITSEVTDYNLFFTLDKALTKVSNSLRQ
ncbi:MAG: hypothetical protein KJ574_01015 [Nanoarchaeota archaeon]|nr:hypothetical protein [Nanoarchaeota archaeon]